MNHPIEQVVASGRCIGCGTCVLASQGEITVQLGDRRLYRADLSAASPQARRAASRVCPFSDEAPNEDVLGVPHPSDGLQHDSRLGWFSRTFAGRVRDEAALRASSSGGLTTWTLCRLAELGVVDAVITVGSPGPTPGELFGYAVTSPDELPTRRRSQYFATTMAEVLQVVAHTEARFAIVGVPCYIKAVRALCREDPLIARRLVVFVGLVCGHLKTQAYAEALAWQLGIAPAELAEVDFRRKDPSRPANDYLFAARAAGEREWRSTPTRDLVGANWGHNAFQPEACNVCDDVVAETADVSFGDAWLPRFAADPRGTNVVISRNPMIDGILLQGAAQGELELEPITAAEAVATQAGGFRHRRDGLAVRLADDLARGLPVPVKRVPPEGRAGGRRRARLVRHRRVMAELSHSAFALALAHDDLAGFLAVMQRQARRYRRYEAGPVRRAGRRLRGCAARVARALGIGAVPGLPDRPRPE